MDHKFGGIWTQQKLNILAKYLLFYTTALKDQPFTLHYVDAFAGTGSHIPDEPENGQMQLISQDSLRGSVSTALEVDPGFHHYHFNDVKIEHIAELDKIKRDYQNKSILITQKDANLFVPEFCASLTNNDRAVLFLDPYSTQLDWATLKVITSTGKIDVWLLFPISVIVRMTPNEGDRIRPEWSQTLGRLLGTDEWEQALYKPIEKTLTADLFDDTANENESTQRLNVQELQNWVTKRLQELFPFVADPVLLRSNNRPLFSFYFLVSNPNKSAWKLAEKVVKHILRNER